jgi:DNA gyrase subunit A
MEIETSLDRESRERYLTYALSVVTGRALPDIRDGLKPVQRRILYAMFNNLGLKPDRAYRKSAAVIGEVLARYHPHGDIACYEAMVRMAQSFSMRYPLVDGQGNFGSLDGDSAAAYRYTEARLQKISLDLLGEIDEETVDFRDNFDSTVKEPTVFPSRFPNLLINGSSGIAVGMATNIPPHNLRDILKALQALSKDSEISNSRLVKIIRGPDFPTGCQVVNTSKELEEIYRSGRGPIKMRSSWRIEDLGKNKRAIIVESIPFAVNKSQILEKIANCIIEKKIPQLFDVRDESTEEIRIVLDITPEANPELVMAFLFKNTPLECNFQVNLTALVPGEGDNLVPCLLSLKECLEHFLEFRKGVVTARLNFEKRNLESRIHLLNGFITIFDKLDEALVIVRKATGRQDALLKIMEHFKLTEKQSAAIVDLRIYQLSKTNISDLRKELKEKTMRVREITLIVSSSEAILEIIRGECEGLIKAFPERRLSLIKEEEEVIELKKEDFVVQEDVFAILTKDGWIKRLRQQNDVSQTRIREGDMLKAVHAVSTLDELAIFTNLGCLYTLSVADFPSSSGFGTPIQKLLKFSDGESVIASYVVSKESLANEASVNNPTTSFKSNQKVLFVTRSGLGSFASVGELKGLKRSGRRLFKVKDDDSVIAALGEDEFLLIASNQGYLHKLRSTDIPHREGVSLGVILTDLSTKKGEIVVDALTVGGNSKVELTFESGTSRKFEVSNLKLTSRAAKGEKVAKNAKPLSLVLIK